MTQHNDLALNLRLLCSYYKSISEVSRRLDISRPQFNRYLNGKFKPAPYTLRRICHFFGVEEHEIGLPHDQFQRLVQLRPQETPTPVHNTHDFHQSKLRALGGQGIEKYTGFYFEYHLSMAAPGKILRNLVGIEMQHGQAVYQRTERFLDAATDKVCHSKYLGMAYYLTDRIFMTDYESLTNNEMTQTILYPTFKSRVTRLHGLRLGAAASEQREPCSTRIMLEYLGKRISIHKALRLCGLYDYDSEEIGDGIREAVTNSFDQTEWVFKAKAHL